MSTSTRPGDGDMPPRWYEGLTRYQWLVLTIASLGWIFDVFEGQIFVASMKEAMPSLLPADSTAGDQGFYNNIALGAFLVGGALGGVVFGSLSDRIGRTRTMIITILVYSCFTCVTAAAQTWWQMAALRFFVAMGVGGEWAVASALVAEVFPARARARSLGIFHASSVLGTYLAVLVGMGIPHFGWRVGFALGAIPALLTLWIRWKLREPERWIQVREASRRGEGPPPGRIADLFSRQLVLHTVVGVSLAAIGLATFWGVHIYGKNLLRLAAENAGSTEPEAKQTEMLGMFLVTTGGGLGLLSFAPISERIGRRGAFLLFHLGGLAAGLVLFQFLATASMSVLWAALPVFGFLTLGMHAGYAVYFPELFPTRLRGTGAGFCFNGGRIIAAPILIIIGWMQKDWGYTLQGTASTLSLLFLLGVVLLLVAPETRGHDLPE